MSKLSIEWKKTFLFMVIDLPIYGYAQYLYGNTWAVFFVTFLITTAFYLPIAHLIWGCYNKKDETETVSS